MIMNRCKKNLNDLPVKIVAHVFLTIFFITCVGAIGLIVGASFQSQEEIWERGYSLIPLKPTLEAYRVVFANPYQLFRSYYNTIITTVIGTICGVLLSASCGYVMSRKKYAYRRILSFYVFFTMMFNGGLVPTYIMISNWFNLKNTYGALIFPLLVNAWYIMLMKGYFAGIPDEIIEAATIDGSNEIYTFIRIVIPMSSSVIATIALFYILGYWNDWYQSLLYVDDSNMYQLQYLLMNIIKSAEFLNSEQGQVMNGVNQAASVPTMNVRMAMCVLATFVMLVVFPFFQKYFVKGIAVGSVKG